MENPPLGGGNKISPLIRFLPLGEISILPAGGIFPTRRHQCRHARGLFLDRPTRVETLCSEIFPLEVPYTDKIFPTRNTNTNLRAPLVWTTGRWIHSSIHISHMGFFLLGRQLSADEIFPTRETTLMWDIPHTEDNSDAKFTPTWKYRDLHSK